LLNKTCPKRKYFWSLGIPLYAGFLCREVWNFAATWSGLGAVLHRMTRRVVANSKRPAIRRHVFHNHIVNSLTGKHPVYILPPHND